MQQFTPFQIFKGHLSEYESIGPLDTQRKGKSLFSRVFTAKDTVNGSLVFIKTLHKRFADDEESQLRLFDEASLELDHPNIIKYIDRGTKPLHFIVCEFIRGKSAGESGRGFFQKKKNHLRFALEAFISLCNAMEYIHKRGIIHCDIKPSNIIVSSTSPVAVKLIDFGQAHLKNGNNFPPRRFSMIYSPPEILLGKYSLSGPQSDIYSAGISLYELITGTYPYKNCNSMMVINLQLNHPLPGSDRIPKDLFAVLQKATAKVPFPKPPQRMKSEEIRDILKIGIAQRYHNASEFREALTNCLKKT